MNPEELFRRYQQLQAYVGWTDDDARRVAAARPLLEAALGPMVDDFYAAIESHPETRRVITGGAAQIARLKETLSAWLRELLAGRYDQDYVARRWRVGWRHVDIGLDQRYTNAALSRLRTGLTRALHRHWTGPEEELRDTARALDRLLDLDLAIIEDAYQTEYSERLRLTMLKTAQERALQSERLATIGQMMAGLAHESGNALARSLACLEILAHDVADRPEAVELIHRLQLAQDHLQQLYQDVRHHAATITLECEDLDVGTVWRSAWRNLELQRRGRTAELHEHMAGVDLHCAVDPFRLEQVFRNVFDNALAATAGPVRLDVTCAAGTLDGRPALVVSVRDHGPGLTPEQRQRIFEPFFTTKTKGSGLGMAIARRIIETHGGRIAVGDATPGTEIVLTLPRGQPAPVSPVP